MTAQFVSSGCLHALKRTNWPEQCKICLLIFPYKTISCLPASITSSVSMHTVFEGMPKRRHVEEERLSSYLPFSFWFVLCVLPLPCCYSRPLYLGHCTHPWGWGTDGNFPPLLPSMFPRSCSPLCFFLCLMRNLCHCISIFAAVHHVRVYETYSGRFVRVDMCLPLRCRYRNS